MIWRNNFEIIISRSIAMFEWDLCLDSYYGNDYTYNMNAISRSTKKTLFDFFTREYLSNSYLLL